MPLSLPLGPVMADVAGLRLTPEERERLLHPMLGGIILFARNCESPAQVAELVAEIKALRSPALLVGIDQEGGRVQRLREGVTRLPPMARLGQRYDADADAGLRLAENAGRLLGVEMRALGIDISFAPVLDLGLEVSAVIGDRAFHREPEGVARLAAAFWRGMEAAGLRGVGKHFPGHGSTALDSHLAIPVDERPLAAIEALDLVPFRRLVDAGIPGMMPAHVIYPQLDPLPAGFSRFWLQDVLRGRLGFAGCIFSDDLSMAGAGAVGGVAERVGAALRAGCDMLLVCNDPAAALQAMQAAEALGARADAGRLERMRGQGGTPWPALAVAPDYLALREEIGRAFPLA
ncbi:beta-N-acetylhexosaminidase [Thermithiobacillus tepidarius DSM 3134]|uniref:beta-N-acetylhexosaminidase n=1 Tax=Thermithiobacillus tepidarius TaxID=929 RepID=UPI0003FCD628|nr:beta-N-acetylhexosaminidase [Thermithiobacillus tepidarius]